MGFVYDSEDMSVSLPTEKIVKVRDRDREMDKLKKVSIRSFASFIGLLVSICPAIPYGWLYTKRFEREKFLALLENQNNFDAIMSLPEHLTKDFHWWERNILLSKNPIRDFTVSLEIFSDSSLSGWGVFSNGKSSHGFWTEEDLSYDINHLELEAAFFGLKCFAREYKNCQILLRIDNTTAISYINRMGSIQFEKLGKIAKDIWKWCELRNIWIFASYIPSKKNVEADLESRILKPETEFELSASAFDEIVYKLGRPSIDLFATRANSKCKNYVSWRPDPDAITVDAFTISWKEHFFMLFPPFQLFCVYYKKLNWMKREV